ncbi:MAG TPA: DUF2207 domain-containing protein [Thermohalobaculum sp.]|nr:DUF2207 domain-containing protein [Thermohalobaculum sp.]
MLFRACALAALLAMCGTAHAEEQIRSFDVEIEVLEDGTLDVTENITVTVEGREIKRGIYRDLPIAYKEEDGRNALATFEVLEVLRNGATERYHRSSEGAYARVYMGQRDVLLPVPAEQRYTLHYRTSGQLRAQQGYDELYWNVTGDRWKFRIQTASVAIRLPDGTEILQHAAYTGPRGATGTDFEVVAVADGVYRARITAPLDHHEGFTVAIGWPKGAVKIPPVQYGVRRATGGYTVPMTLGGVRLGPIAAVLGTMLGALALLLGWLRVGRDPAGGAIYPRFEPPAGLSPAATRYLKKFGFGPKCLTAAILSMAVKGALRIAEQPSASLFRDKEYTLDPLGAKKRGLTTGENAAYWQLFPGSQPLTLTANEICGARVDKARAELKSKLWDEHYGASFRRNTGYTVGGIAAGVIISITLILITERGNMMVAAYWGAPALLCALLTYAAGFLLVEFGDMRQGGRPTIGRLAKVLAALFFVVTFGGSLLSEFSFDDILAFAEPSVAYAGAAFGVVAMLFHFLMAAPSKAGRKILDEIAGFEIYLRTAEEDRLDILSPPERTPELFEQLLPYAVALGLSHQWAAKFADVLAKAAQPVWYSGSGQFDIGGFERGFSHAVSSTTAPSRGSGGSGGGGSSGGGGGGGGGGGW